MDVQIGSYNGHKISASRKGVSDIFPGISLSVKGHEVDQGLNKQIEGKDEILAAAFHRLKNLKAKLAAEEVERQAKSKEIIAETRADLLLVMQDGIYSEVINGEVHWYNMAWVIAEDIEGKQQVNFSSGLEIDADIVEEARQRGFESTTIGDIIAERAGPNADPTNPQSLLTQNILGRPKILLQVIKIAIGQLLMKSASLKEIRSQCDIN